jgi:SAM-dependent methyltransferase
VNTGHAQLCSSPEWAEHIATTVLPAAVGTLDLGDEVLEIGPGYGASTRVLVDAVPSLTAVEVDESLALELASSYPRLAVVHGSGDDLPFDDGRFTAVVCFTMLHHVHTAVMQDALFAQARRVLRPRGVFAGSDSIASTGLHDFHADDIYVPVDPLGLAARLTAAGFADVEVDVPQPEWFTFLARA